MASDPDRPHILWPAETPEEHLQRYLRENPPAPRVVPRQSLLGRIVMVAAVAGSFVLLGALSLAIFRGIVGWP